MALKKNDEKVDEVEKETAAKTAKTTTPATEGDAGTQTKIEGSPALQVEPTEPPAEPVVQKTEKELQAEKDAEAAQAQQRLDDEAAVREQAGKPEKKRLELVPVENLRPTAFMQYSTGKWIQGHSTENLLDDGWLENHVKAKLLKRL